tara:strand:+ start:1398 stop:2408 length:1011 start_codon:yes stop_codon:yes gene_type:complete
MVKLTIAIPSFNGGKNLERAIRSCKNLQLSMEDYEILVVDNCSTDNSVHTVKKLKNEFKNLKLVENQENVGRIQNWNVSIDNSNGKFLIFLFSNDMINEDNNIHDCLSILDTDEAISIGFASLLKREIDTSYVKKSFSSDIIQCKSYCFTKECLNRGLLPFGPIQSIIYRKDDIRKDNNRFLETMPINADEIFTYKEALKRERILFSPKPQITWDLTQGRFHGQMKIEDEFNEHSETIKIISEQIGIQVDYGLVSTYRAINLLKFSTGNLKSEGKKVATMHLLSKMKQSKSFFNADKILLKTFVEKIKNSKKDADDILYSSIISDCQKLEMEKYDK